MTFCFKAFEGHITEGFQVAEAEKAVLALLAHVFQTAGANMHLAVLRVVERHVFVDKTDPAADLAVGVAEGGAQFSVR